MTINFIYNESMNSDNLIFYLKWSFQKQEQAAARSHICPICRKSRIAQLVIVVVDNTGQRIQ